MYIALPPRSTVSLRKAGQQGEAGDAWKLVPEPCDKAGGHFGNLNEPPVRKPLLGGKFRMGCSRRDGIGISERIAGGPKQGLARQSLGWLMGLHFQDRTERGESF